ncbi:hypothetical protein AGMMS49982_24160 [Bacteroidia bacterium]|nr:hypothetical protein AGMMS49982_24160 [Bacteroidia bacterium]
MPYELAGKTFGGTMELYFQAMCSDLKKPSKALDASYGGEYDFWLDGIKIEVKAGRTLDKDSKEPWFKKALSLNTAKNFDVILEQIKPNCCDVVVFIAAFRNDILLWILNSKEVVELPTYSAKQHRGNTGEGQFHIKQANIKLLDKYKFTGKNLKLAIETAAKRNKKTTNKNKK